MRDRDVQSGDTDACALGEAKATRWACVLWMLVLAVASARRFAHQMHTLRYRFHRVSLSAEDAQ